MGNAVFEGTYSITGGTIHSGDVIYAYLNGLNEYVASSKPLTPTITYGGDTFDDTSNGWNCTDTSCSAGQFRLQFAYDDVYENQFVTFKIVSVNHGELPVGTTKSPDVPANAVACNVYPGCDTQTPNVTFSVPYPTHTLNRSDGNPVSMLDNTGQDLNWNYTSVNDGYGNTNLYWTDQGQTTNVYVSNHDWVIKKEGTIVNVSSYSSLASNTSIEEDLRINFQPDEIVSNIETESYTVKLTSRVISMNSYNDGFFDDSTKTYTINVTNSDYITPITNQCGAPTATNYVCLNSMYGENSDYCPGGGCTFGDGSCSANMWVDDDLIVTINNSTCNYQPGAPVLNVSNVPGTLVVNYSAIGSTDPNGNDASDLEFYVYDFNDGTTETVTSPNSRSKTYTSAGDKWISLKTIDYAGSESTTTTVNFALGLCGCTDSLADNYDAVATLEDGTCVYHGCPYDAASNSFCDASTCGFGDGTQSCEMSWPCPSSGQPGGNGVCVNPNPTYNLSAVDDDGTCVFPEPYTDPGYTEVITSYTEAGTQGAAGSNFQVIHGSSTYDLAAPDLDSELLSRANTNYSINFVPYFPELIPKIEAEECPDYCDPTVGSGGYCDQSSCNNWHDGLMLDTTCTGVCDGGSDGNCHELNCSSDCSADYCSDVGSTNACCPYLSGYGCTSEANCSNQFSAKWCDNGSNTCCSGTAAGTCSSYYKYNLFDDDALAAQCLFGSEDGGGCSGYGDQCCEEGDCIDFYEDISTQFADYLIPLADKGSPTYPTPAYIGYVGDSPQWIDDVLNFTGTFSIGDQIIGRRYNEDTKAVEPGAAPATYLPCPTGTSLGPNCGDRVCGESGFGFLNPAMCNNPVSIKRLMPGRGYIFLTSTSGNISFNIPVSE